MGFMRLWAKGRGGCPGGGGRIECGMGNDADIDWGPWGGAVAAAFASGGRASGATVFVAAGGSSYAIEALWPGDGLSVLARARERARLAIEVEEALPGWLWTIKSVPISRDDKGWSLARYELSPFDQAQDGLVNRAVKGRAGAPGELARAMELLDSFAGAPSWRLRFEGRGLHANLARGGRPSDSEMMVPEQLRSGVGARGFAAGMAARACQLALRADCPLGSDEAAAGRAAVRRI